MGSEKPPVAANIRLAQAERGITNEALAREMGVAVRTVSQWRAGSVTPSWGNLKRLAEVLGHSPDWFYVER